MVGRSEGAKIKRRYWRRWSGVIVFTEFYARKKSRIRNWWKTAVRSRIIFSLLATNLQRTIYSNRINLRLTFAKKFVKRLIRHRALVFDSRALVEIRELRIFAVTTRRGVKKRSKYIASEIIIKVINLSAQWKQNICRESFTGVLLAFRRDVYCSDCWATYLGGLYFFIWSFNLRRADT